MRKLLTILFFFILAHNAIGQEMFYALNKSQGPSPNAFVTTWAIPSASYTLSIPFIGANNFVIDWGDGTSEIVNTSTTKTHTYTASGTYTIAIDGTCPSINFLNKTELRTITAWGNIGCTSFSCQSSGLTTISATSSSVFFSGCANLQNSFRFTALTAIPAGLFNSATGVTSFRSAFQNCTALTAIPAGLFNNNTSVTDFTTTFSGCSGLTTIPTGLFDYNTGVLTFATTFSFCSGLTTIPTGLFNNNTAVISFLSTFQNCTALTTIPTGLFNNNTAVTNFNLTFGSCSGLTGAIPTGLFDNNTAANNFQQTFGGCNKLTAIPAGLFNNNTAANNFNGTFNGCTSVTSDVPTLWVSYPSATHTQCFLNCTSASNYSSIPSDWK